MRVTVLLPPLLLFAFFCSSGVNAQWRQVGVGLSAGNKGASFIDPERGYVCGQNGTLLFTTNGGDDWDTIPVPTSVELWGVYASAGSNGDIVFIAGENGLLLASIDAGKTWVAQDPRYARGVVFGLSGINARTLCLTGGEGDFGSTVGMIVVTQDSGATWRKTTIPGTSSFDKSFFVTPDIGYAAGSVDASFLQGVVYKTTDGGATWVLKKTFDAAVNSMYWFDELRGIAVGFNGLVTRTNDGGDSWTPITLPPSIASDPFTHIDFRDTVNGYIADGFGRIVKTTDGGMTWDVDIAFIGNGSPLWGLAIGHGDRRDRVVAVGDGGAIFTLLVEDQEPSGQIDPAQPEAADRALAGGMLRVEAWPNPIVAIGGARVDLRVTSHLSVALFDIAGRERILLHDGTTPRGSHTFTICSEELPEGLYYCRARTPDAVAGCIIRVIH